jgi:hypothetical protein
LFVVVIPLRIAVLRQGNNGCANARLPSDNMYLTHSTQNGEQLFFATLFFRSQKNIIRPWRSTFRLVVSPVCSYRQNHRSCDVDFVVVDVKARNSHGSNGMLLLCNNHSMGLVRALVVLGGTQHTFDRLVLQRLTTASAMKLRLA